MGQSPVTACFLFDPDQVPQELRPRLNALVAGNWYPSGLESLDNNGFASSVLVTANQPLSEAALRRFPALNLIVATGTAFDYIDIRACSARGITVCNTPSYSGSSVAEHAFALMMASARHICSLDSAIHAGRIDVAGYVGCEMHGKTVGIIGLGEIGSRIAAYATGFGMKVLFSARTPRPQTPYTQVDTASLLRESDFIFLTLPLTPESHHLLGRNQFRTMKPTARIVNISSDELIDPEALRMALTEEWIAGAALDLIGSAEPYRDMPHLILTPTQGWFTTESIYRRAATWIRTLEAYLKGETIHAVA